MHKLIDFIIVNDTRRPSTGGDYVYSVMKGELIRQGYNVNEVSVPFLMNSLGRSDTRSLIRRASQSPFEILAYILCYLASLERYKRDNRLVITSSCPTFPVLGHMTYHQPKAGIFARQMGEIDSIKRRIGYEMEENGALSPLWFFAKKLMRLHLSNSKFTHELVKRIYDVDSNVLYPPVPVQKYLRFHENDTRKPYVLLTRPEATTGVSFIRKVVIKLPKNIKLIIIGKADRTGKRILRELKDIGANFEYLGFVDERSKVEIFQRCSIYINLAINETFGMTVVEALAAGCIPIAHNSGAIPEYLPQEFCYSNLDEVAEKVGMYINSKRDVRERIRNIAFKFDEAVFRMRFMSFLRTLEASLED